MQYPSFQVIGLESELVTTETKLKTLHRFIFYLFVNWVYCKSNQTHKMFFFTFLSQFMLR